MSRIVGVLIEFENNTIKPANAGVLTLACKNSPAELYAIIFSSDQKVETDDLSRYGVENIIHINLPEDRRHNPDVRARAVAAAVKSYKMTSLLGLSTSKGKDILPRIAALMDAPLVMDCVDVDLAHAVARTSQYSGKTMATIKVEGRFCMFGIRPNVIEAEECRSKAQILDYDAGIVEERGLSVLKAGKTDDNAAVSLTEANVIVSGGRGMKSGDNFDLIKTFARLLNGAPGASRVAVDSDWVPYALQVGQTGEKVSPCVYIACGISGSIQHFAGMKTAGMIIAINTDENAAMVANCDYFAKADALELIPKIIQILEND